ncbi:MAG: DNA repair exonuclease [Planctomycetota bacterium]
MSGESFRFIHASDFHLENPLGDLDELPPPLREAMASAPFDAAEKVFEAALSSNIDFVVLTGDLLHPQTAGPYALNFLITQFEKLAEAKTPVYWAGGKADDPSNWPEACLMPPNVTLLPRDRIAGLPVTRGGRTICKLVGRSSDGRSSLHISGFEQDSADDYTIGVGYGDASPETLSEAKLNLWCLGGRHNREELARGEDVEAVYAGTPQGRALSESGAHGYSIVDVDADWNLRVSDMPCDAFRYEMVKLHAGDIAAVGSIENLIGERIIRMQHEAAGKHLIIGWEITVESGETLATLGDGQKLLDWMRREYGHGSPAAWSTSLRIRPPQKYPKSWNDEDTILGDYLRIAANRRKDEGEINLLPMTEEHAGLPANTTALLAEVPPSRRVDTLEQATLLGVELLRGGKPNWMNGS